MKEFYEAIAALCKEWRLNIQLMENEYPKDDPGTIAALQGLSACTKDLESLSVIHAEEYLKSLEPLE